MTARGLIAAAIASIALVGCATIDIAGFRFFKVTKTCETNSCPVIDVSVQGNPPYLKVSADTLLMKHGNEDANIIWQLRTDGYEFRDDSISFYNPTRAETQFSKVGPTNKTKTYHLRDKNKDDVYAYGYQIKVYEVSSGIWIPLDPWVVNN